MKWHAQPFIEKAASADDGGGTLNIILLNINMHQLLLFSEYVYMRVYVADACAVSDPATRATLWWW